MIRQALLQAIRQSDLSIRDKAKLRFALVFRGEEIEQVAMQGVTESNLVIPTSNINSMDWKEIITFFIEVILPLLLKLLG